MYFNCDGDLLFVFFFIYSNPTDPVIWQYVDSLDDDDEARYTSF